jgi:hypothetical protein
MRKFIFLAIFLLGASVVALPAFAQDQAADLTGQSANVFGDGAALTSSSGASAADIVADFLASEGLGEATLASLVQTAEIPGQRGVTHFRFAQEVGGLTVYGTYVRAAIDADGQLIHLIENLADAAGGVSAAFVGPRAALNAALNRVHTGISVDLSETGRAGNAVSFGGDSFFWSDPTATRVAIVMNNGALHEGFLVETWTNADNQLNHTLIGGQGNVLGVQKRTYNDSYNVFPIDPGMGDQEIKQGPGICDVSTPCAGESPIGWLHAGTHKSVNILGNNVNAYLEHDSV